MAFGKNALERPDGNRFQIGADVAAAAGGLAGRAADTAAHGRKRVGVVGDLIAQFQLVAGNGRYITACIRVNRAGRLALDHSPPMVHIRHSHLVFMFGHKSLLWNGD